MNCRRSIVPFIAPFIVPFVLGAGLLPLISSAATPAASATVAPASHAAASANRIHIRPDAPVQVDLNSADVDTLMTLPGIGRAEAGRIVAGRPYLSKAFLVTKNILTMAQYEAISPAIIARQKNTPPASGAKKGKKT